MAMFPRLRLFVKKRGSRRTVTPWVSKVTEGLLSAGLVILGVVGIYWLTNYAVSETDVGRWPWFAMLIPLALVVYGIVGIVSVLWTSAISTERRAAVVQKATDWELPGVDEHLSRPTLPSIPPIDTVTDSAGVRLAYRLPIDAASNWVSFTMAAVCIGWNALVVVFVVQVIALHIQGNPNWLLTWLMVPLVLAGVWTLGTIARQLFLNAAMGATLVEVSQHPFYPGGTFHGFVSQTGKVHVRWMQIQLICEEQAIYPQGTDTRRAIERVFRKTLFSQRKFEIVRQQAFESTFDITLPETAMHSFVSPHNAVIWSLVVCGRLGGWGDFERRFPVYVYPLRTAAPTVNPNAILARVSS